MIRYLLHYALFMILVAAMLLATWSIVPSTAPEAVKIVTAMCCAVAAAWLVDRVFPRKAREPDARKPE